MEYQAVITKEGQQALAEFPDAPGCQTFADPGEDIRALAQEALEGCLEAYLADGKAPPRPHRHRRVPKGAKLLTVPVGPTVAVRVQFRWARQDLGLSQADLAERLGVSRQQISQIESPDCNLTLETLRKVAEALGKRVSVELKPA